MAADNLASLIDQQMSARIEANARGDVVKPGEACLGKRLESSGRRALEDSGRRGKGQSNRRPFALDLCCDACGLASGTAANIAAWHPDQADSDWLTSGWFARAMAGPGIRQATLSPEIAVDTSYLPGELHGDPADRLLIATTCHFGIPIVIRDTKIIAHAAQGFIQAIAC